VLLTAVFVSGDDLLPDRAGNVRRSVTGAEVVTRASRDSPGSVDDVVLVDSTPVECARSVQRVRTPRAAILACADQTERDVALRLFAGLLALAAGVWLNHYPTRAFAALAARSATTEVRGWRGYLSS
jgi:hypothetical protein